jgi:hypothetical protein
MLRDGRKGIAAVTPQRKGKRALLTQLVRLLIILAVGVVAFAVWGTVKAAWWSHLVTLILEHPDYAISTEDLQLPKVPPWLRRDIRLDIWERMKERGLESTLQPGLAQRIFSIVTEHPWVSEVHSVRLSFPRSVVIELEYRRPVCLVVGTAFAVDAQGVALPASDLQDANLPLYLLVGIEAGSAVVPGHRWPDGRVIEAGQLAEFLGTTPFEKGFMFIVSRVTFRPLEPDDLVFTLRNREGKEIFWGRVPGRELQGEPPANLKKNRLLALLEDPSQILPHQPVDLTLSLDVPAR